MTVPVSKYSMYMRAVYYNIFLKISEETSDLVKITICVNIAQKRVIVVTQSCSESFGVALSHHCNKKKKAIEHSHRK